MTSNWSSNDRRKFARRRIDGALIGADETSVVIRPDSGDERTIAHDDIQSARTVFDWSSDTKPGGRAKQASERAAS